MVSPLFPFLRPTLEDFPEQQQHKKQHLARHKQAIFCVRSKTYSKLDPPAEELSVPEERVEVVAAALGVEVLLRVKF